MKALELSSIFNNIENIESQLQKALISQPDVKILVKNNVRKVGDHDYYTVGLGNYN